MDFLPLPVIRLRMYLKTITDYSLHEEIFLSERAHAFWSLAALRPGRVPKVDDVDTGVMVLLPRTGMVPNPLWMEDEMVGEDIAGTRAVKYKHQPMFSL